MIFTKSALIWHIFALILLKNHPLLADSGEDFLNAAITRLKQQQYFDDYQNPIEEIFGEIRRSIRDYKVEDTSESLDNQVDQQNGNFIDQLGENEQQKNPTSGLYTEANIKQPWNDFQQFNLNPYNADGIQALPQDPNLSAQNLEAYAASLNAFPVNADPLQQYNYAGAAVNNQVLQNNGMSNEVAQNNVPLVPMNYYYNPADNSIDDNLLDEAINAMKTPYDQLGQDPGKKFIVEPLFVAMAGFVGIAMIFMSAVLFLPKLVTPPPTVNGLRGPQELAALTKLAVEAIEGNDCTERIACEVGRAMRGMQVGSQPIKMIEVMLPANLAKQLAQIRKAVATKQSCKLIQCKKLSGTPEQKINKKATPELKNVIITLNKKNEKPEPKKP